MWYTACMDTLSLELECAPLEGITDAVYRRVHHRIFPGATRYYTPFISPTQNRRFAPRELRELATENNPGLHLIPQLLGKNAGDFRWAAEEIAAMGYDEVNLNLGCPSGTVFAKGKGAGLLAHPDDLARFLDEIYAAVPLKISIKTRLGVSSPDEFRTLLPLFNRYPVHRLIVHARTRAEMYTPGVHLDAFAWAVQNTDIPLSYNGDLFTCADIRRFRRKFPGVPSVMLGRGLIADPGLITRLNGSSVSKADYRRFHDELCAEYPIVFGSRSSAMHRMKAIWFYMLDSFQHSEAYRKKLTKAKRWEDYLAVIEEVFDRLELKA